LTLSKQYYIFHSNTEGGNVIKDMNGHPLRRTVTLAIYAVVFAAANQANRADYMWLAFKKYSQLMEADRPGPFFF
jgi:hypothetical protein